MAIQRPRAIRRMTAHGVALAAAAVAGPAAIGPAAAAAPVKAGATPLLLTGRLPTTCPKASDLDGSGLARLVRSGLPTTNAGFAIAIPLSLIDFLPEPAITLCDPALAASRGVLGAFGGATAHELGEDLLGYGSRALGAGTAALGSSQLEVGDRLTLPQAGPRSVLDLSVATAGGAVSTRIAPLGTPAATAVRIEGSPARPVVVVERGTDEPTRVAVRPAEPAPSRFRARLHGTTLSFRGRAAPGSYVFAISTARGAASIVGMALAGRSGSVPAVDVVKLRRGNREASLVTVNLARRQLSVVSCRLRWAARLRRPTSVRCGAVRPPAAAARASGPGAAGGAAPSRVSARRPSVAQRAAVRPTVAASATEIASDAESEFALVGDINGDGRPDAVATSSTTGESRLLISTPAGAWSPLDTRYPVDPVYKLDSIPEVAPDMTGDGRAEPVAADGTLVTDTFGGAAAPAMLDLRAERPPRPGDINLGGRSAGQAGPWWTATGALADATGDGRPEPVVRLGAATATFASQDIAPGTVSHLASPFPLALASLLFVPEVEEPTEGATDDRYKIGHAIKPEYSVPTADQLLGPPDSGTLAQDGLLTTLEPTQSATPSSKTGGLLLRTRDAGGRVLSSGSVTLGRTVKLLDRDPVSGDVLIAWGPKVCTSEVPDGCLDHVTRAAADGRSISSVQSDTLDSAAFVEDGVDADTQPDVVIWDLGSSEPSVDFVLLPSTTTGQVPIRSLPALTVGGRVLRVAGSSNRIVLPNGSRWLGTTTLRGDRQSLVLLDLPH